MKRTSFAVATLLVAGLASLMLADDAKKKTDVKTDVKADVKANVKANVKGEKPKAAPGWVILEEDWWFPFRYDFAESLHNARVHYRAKEERAAAGEIDKAISWLKYAENHADKATAEELSTARADLFDFSMALKNGKPVIAKKLEAAFAHASAALARHHHYKSSEAFAKGDMRAASSHLLSAVEYLRAAARSANHEYGSEIFSFYDDYAPDGYWDDTVVIEKSQLESNLTQVEKELVKLAEQLKSDR